MGISPKIVKYCAGVMTGGTVLKEAADSLAIKLTKFRGNRSLTLKEAEEFLKNPLGISGRPIENFEKKIEIAIKDSKVNEMISDYGNIRQWLRFYAENPTIGMIEADPKLFLFSSKTAAAQNKTISIAEKFSKCRSKGDLWDLVLSAETVEDCNYIANKLVGSNAIVARQSAIIKADFLLKQMQNGNIAKRIGETYKAYVSPQISIK